MLKYTNHIILIFSICCSINILFAQQKVIINIEDNLNNVTYSGSLTYKISPESIVSHENNIHTIEFNNEPNEKIISLHISDLTWNNRNHGSIVIKKNWLNDNSSNLKSQVPCVEIEPGASVPIDIKVNGEGSGSLKVAFALKPKNKDCREIKLKDHTSDFFNIAYVVKGLSKASSKDSAVTSTNDANIPKAERLLWQNCGQDTDYSISCLVHYLSKYPNGHFAKTAIKYCDKIARKTHFPKIKELIQLGDTEKTIEACEAFLNFFPKQISVYEKVENILKEAKNSNLSSKTKNNKEGRKIEDQSEIVSINIGGESSKEEKAENPKPRSKAKAKAKAKSKAKAIIKSEDQLAWEAIENTNDCKQYEAYYTRKPQYLEEYREKALLLKSTFCDITIRSRGREANNYSFIVGNVFSLVLDSIHPPIEKNFYKIIKHPDHQFEYILNLNFPDEQNYLVHLSDKSHPNKSISRTRIIDNLGDLLEPEIEMTADSILFTFNHGTKPFNIYFRHNDGGIAYEVQTEERHFSINKSFLKKEKAFSGSYVIEVSDEILNAPYTKAPENENWSIDIQQDIWHWSYFIPVGLFSILLVFFLRKKVSSKTRDIKQKEFEQFIGSRKESLAELRKKKVAEHAFGNVEENKEMKKSNPLEYSDKTGSSIKLKGLRKSSTKVLKIENEAELIPFLETSVFAFEPPFHWEDSIIERIYFSKKSILSLDKFLVSQNLKPLAESDDMIPEIGGILMGRPNLVTKNGKYQIIIEEFVPINPEFHNVYKLEFSTQSLVKDLGDIQDLYPAYTAVGWFHTHPGHGLFLSKPDLIIQDQFFSEPYQFAMEIDSLTEKLDTAFFTRTMDGTINNTSQKIENTSWFSWLENVAALEQS